MERDIYDELGVQKVINAWGTVTRLGGSRMAPEVLQAMESASHSFVDMAELHAAAGKRIARLLGVEACCVTCGASAGLAVAMAACMTGGRASYAYQLPDTTGMKNEVVALKCHRDLYDQAILLSGARFVEVGVTAFSFLQQVEDRIGDQTAALFYTSEAETMRGSIPFRQVAELCRSKGVPVIVDAAAELPPLSNINRYLDEGASLVVFSGGKEIRGPQASGMILGSRELIAACDLNCCPNYGIGRPMKVDKENICGLVRAVELFTKRDYGRQMEIWEGYAHRLYDGLKGNSHLELKLGYPLEPGVQPACILRLFVRPLSLTADEFCARLIAHRPSIQTFRYQDQFVVNPQCLEEEELQPVIDAILEIAG